MHNAPAKEAKVGVVHMLRINSVAKGLSHKHADTHLT